MFVSGFGLPVVAEVIPSIGTAQIAATSAASYTGIGLAPESIVALFGTNLSAETKTASMLLLPGTLTGASINLRDSRGNEYLAPLFFTSPNQINFQVPANVPLGAATISVVTNGNSNAPGTVEVVSVNPGLFSADASGTGLAAATVLRVRSNGEQVYEPVARSDPATNRIVAVPIDVGNPAEQVFLLLFGTGLRHRSGLANVTAQVGDVNVEVLFAGAQSDFVGLDQVNLRLPQRLAGRSEQSVTLTVDGKMTNSVKVYFK